MTALKQYFVCATRDITNEPYAGVSGRHEVDGQAINTTNGAGPHNLQLFMLSSDGTILNVLPGYWNPEDLVNEMQLAYDLNAVWKNNSLSQAQKNQRFHDMHLAHINEHSRQMVRRSRMQSFDQEYEAKHRLNTSDTITDPQLVAASYSAGNKMAANAGFKTTDQIFHQRLATRPFQQLKNFDVASYVDYGRPKYDKHEDQRDLSGERVVTGPTALIGDTSKLRPMNRKRMRRQQFQQKFGAVSNNGVVNYTWR